MKERSLDGVGSADLAERNLRFHPALAVWALFAFGFVVENVAWFPEDASEMLVVEHLLFLADFHVVLFEDALLLLLKLCIGDFFG